MKELENYNLKEKIVEMIDDFYGSNDSEAFLNIKTPDGLVQFGFTLISEEEDDFSTYEGIKTIDITDLI